MIKLPYTFKSQKAEQMSVKAFDLKKEKKFDDAISLYGQAIKVEPDNPKLFFDLSECYMSIDKLEQAILLLDTAIMLDPFRSAFYNNRGLNQWHLYKNEAAIRDYQKALEFDSSNWVIYSNLSIAYFGNKEQLEACKMFKIAKKFGLNMANYKEDENLRIIEKLCQ